jgi:hypothetical protein
MSSLTEKTRNAEFKMITFFATKNVPLSLTEQLIALWKSVFHDSKIVKNMSIASSGVFTREGGPWGPDPSNWLHK